MIRTGAFGEGIDVDAALADAQSGFEGFHDSRPVACTHAQTVLHDFEQVLLLGVDARVALALEELFHLLDGKVFRHRYRERNDERRGRAVTSACQQIRNNRVRRVARDAAPAAAAVQVRCAREKQLQVIIELSHRAHSRARGSDRIGLVDGDRRGNALDGIHLRLVHAVQKLSRVGRESFYISALTLGIERVEHKGRLARAGDAGYDDELVRGELKVEGLQVVLAGTGYADGVGHRCRAMDRRSVRHGAGRGAKSDQLAFQELRGDSV